MESLTTKYRPQTLTEIVGQPDVVEQLSLYLADPYSAAFLFEGETGTGKTSTAFILAQALGVDVAAGGFGGFYEIASGEQTGESVRAVMDSMRMSSWSGSGWRVLVVNEADCMSANASYVWLDVLENLPPKVVIIFTTNNAHRLPARLRDRCERLRFESGGILMLPYLQELVDRIWLAETGQANAPDYSDFGPVQDERGHVSVRRLLQNMQPFVRAKKRPARPAPAQVAMQPTGELSPARKAWITRRARMAANRN